MKVNRRGGACTVFEGKIIVSGGENEAYINFKLVEAYDYYKNGWTLLPDMIARRVNHLLISMSNTLFVICGKNNCGMEVFDSVNIKFTYLKHVKYSSFLNNV